jgi:hypothetical protein
MPNCLLLFTQRTTMGYLPYCNVEQIQTQCTVGVRSLHYRMQAGLTMLTQSIFSCRQCGARFDGVDDGGSTALHLAVCYGRARAVKKLLELGANPNAQSTMSGETPIMGVFDSFEIVSLLITAGADAKIKRQYGLRALDDATRYANNSVVVDCIAKRIRQQDAVLLLDWMMALAPLQLPICELIHVWFVFTRGCRHVSGTR